MARLERLDELVQDLATAECFSILDGIWAARDSDPDKTPLEWVMGMQRAADERLKRFADRVGIPSETVEERADALLELRRLNANRLGLSDGEVSAGNTSDQDGLVGGS